MPHGYDGRGGYDYNMGEGPAGYHRDHRGPPPAAAGRMPVNEPMSQPSRGPPPPRPTVASPTVPATATPPTAPGVKYANDCEIIVTAKAQQ